MPKIPIQTDARLATETSQVVDKGLQPFLFHGVDLSKRVSGGSGGDQAIGDCPFCSKASKFYINVDSGEWDCKICGLSGNIYTFLNQLWEMSLQQTEDHVELAEERGLLYTQTLDEWGVKKHLITNEWIVPAYNVEGKLVQLYRYVNNNNHFELRPTKGLAHGIHGVSLYDSKKPIIYLTEGVWDGIILWETLREAKIKNVSVLATPSANVFREQWLPLFGGKVVCLMYDSDHPKKLENGLAKKPVGYEAMKKLTGMLMTSSSPPKEVRYLKWGPNGYDGSKPIGYDVRDYLRGK